MKKLNAKFIASSALAVITASVMAVSASAAGTYYWPPVYPPVDNNTAATATETPKDDSATIVVTGSAIGEDAVKEAVKTGKPIEATIGSDGKLILSEAAVSAIRGSDKPVTIIVNSSEVPYVVTIDPKDVNANKEMNIAMHIHTGLPDGFTAGAGTDQSIGVIFIGPEMKGTWPISLGLTIPASALKDLDFSKIGLYYIADDGQVSDISENLVKNADGSVTITSLSHASAYVISDVDLTLGDIDAGLDIDDADDDIIDDNIDDVTDDVTIDEPSTTTGKDDTSVVVNAGGNDTNPVTGTTLALGSLAVFAAAAIATSKKRK